ncbi:hypothetical protein E0H35_13340 [Rhizobium leguminosarum bv. viciae]|nr:hypothetical protein [Rhizobium leguminosarum bv. viciae]TBZ00125.1 hypothetical protein E0H35_13340 [Rhizobium leguminosarum bv. viciae]
MRFDSLPTSLALYSASSSALCRGSATYQPAADARDKPEHDVREVGRLCQQSEGAPKRPDILRR